MNRWGGAVAALRFFLTLCLLLAVSIGGFPTHGAQAQPSVIATHTIAAPDLAGSGSDIGTIPHDANCVLHIVCQGVIPALGPAWTAPCAKTPRRPVRFSAPDSLAAPPLPQPPNFS